MNRGNVMDEKEVQRRIQTGRNFIRPCEEETDWQSDQDMKKPQPPLVKAPMREKAIQLPIHYEDLPIDRDFLHIINSRQSHRVYTQENMTLNELSYLLWCTQGVKGIRGKSYATLRTVPCGGARHEFECYFAVRRVEGLEPGFYHYLPMTHQIEFLSGCDDLETFICESLEEQKWAARANVVFYYSFVPYRAEWRYGIYAHRIVLVDAGHITENLYLACTSIGLGGCAVGAVCGSLADQVFGLDGEEEYIFYAHPVGTISENNNQAELDFYSFVKEQGL